MSLPDNSYEESVVARNSTPGLRRNILTRVGKLDHLGGSFKSGVAEIKEIMDKLYPPGSEL